MFYVRFHGSIAILSRKWDAVLTQRGFQSYIMCIVDYVCSLSHWFNAIDWRLCDQLQIESLSYTNGCSFGTMEMPPQSSICSSENINDKTVSIGGAKFSVNAKNCSEGLSSTVDTRQFSKKSQVPVRMDGWQLSKSFLTRMFEPSTSYELVQDWVFFRLYKRYTLWTEPHNSTTAHMYIYYYTVK